MWSIYEIGYLDNDICALRYESDPVLTQEAIELLASPRRAWRFVAFALISAVLLGGAGLYILSPKSIGLNSSKWAGAMLGLGSSYFVYNRIDKDSRSWLYPVLQFWRNCSLLLVAPLSIVAIGVAFIQLTTRWQEYFLYRYVRKFGVRAWPGGRRLTMRLVLLIVFLLCVTLSSARQAIAPLPGLALLAWAAFSARRELSAIFAHFHTIARGRRLEASPPPMPQAPRPVAAGADRHVSPASPNR